MDIGTVEPCGVIPRRLKISRFETDQRAESGGMIDREIEHDAATDRASHHHGPVERQRLAESTDGLGVARGGELILLAAPARRWIRFAMPGQIEGDDTEIFCELRVR